MPITGEQISDEFGLGEDYPNIIEQTLSQSFDPFSGLDIDTASFQNTKQGLLDNNSDGRIPLGLFFFDEENIFKNSFPSVIANNLFRQLPLENLIKNGSCKFIKAKPYPTGLLKQLVWPLGDWNYCTLDGAGYRNITNLFFDTAPDNLLNETTPAIYYDVSALLCPRYYDLRLGNSYAGSGTYYSGYGSTNLSFWEQHGSTSSDEQGAIGYAGYYPYYGGISTKGFKTNEEMEDWVQDINHIIPFSSAYSNSILDDNGEIIINADTGSDVSSFTNMAKWMETEEAYSYGRCLSFTAADISTVVTDTVEPGVYTRIFKWGDINVEIEPPEEAEYKYSDYLSKNIDDYTMPNEDGTGGYWNDFKDAMETISDGSTIIQNIYSRAVIIFDGLEVTPYEFHEAVGGGGFTYDSNDILTKLYGRQGEQNGGLISDASIATDAFKGPLETLLDNYTWDYQNDLLGINSVIQYDSVECPPNGETPIVGDIVGGNVNGDDTFIGKRYPFHHNLYTVDQVNGQQLVEIPGRAAQLGRIAFITPHPDDIVTDGYDDINPIDSGFAVARLVEIQIGRDYYDHHIYEQYTRHSALRVPYKSPTFTSELEPGYYKILPEYEKEFEGYEPSLTETVIDNDGDGEEDAFYNTNSAEEKVWKEVNIGRVLQHIPALFLKILYDLGVRDLDESFFIVEEGVDIPPTIMNNVNFNQYRTLNQVYKFWKRSEVEDTEAEIFINQSLEVKFKMKTMNNDYYKQNNPPEVEIAITDYDGSVGNPSRYENVLSSTGANYEDYPFVGFARNQYYYPHGDFNTLRYDADNNSTGTLDSKTAAFGSMGRFKNTQLDTWETFSYVFTLGELFGYSSGKMKDLSLIVQAGNNFYGQVYLDDFEVYETGDFIPDVDVRKKISTGVYGKADLTKYYDKDLQSEEYPDSISPLEAQFYFYPNYSSTEIFDKKRTPVYQDFKKGLFYIYDIDWGDASPKEFKSEPKKIDENTALYHLYKTSGIFEITGYMIRMKGNEDADAIGILHAKKFTLRININEGGDEEFTYFGSDGFSFIPYKNTTPIIGGYSNQSIYYKSIKRQVGFISDNFKTNVEFKNPGDKLKTELALLKMDYSRESEFDILPNYLEERTDSNGATINNGINPFRGELGKSIGDTDITNIKYYNTPKPMWEILGFESDIAGNPIEERYYKKIISENYSIFNREGLLLVGDNEIDYLNMDSQQDWLDGSYYPVLPKYNLNGKFQELKLDEDGNVPLGFYPNNKIPFPLEGPITNELENNTNLIINITNDVVENNVLNDTSGNKNLGFTFSDYKPKFDNKTIQPKITKTINKIKTSKNNGAF